MDLIINLAFVYTSFLSLLMGSVDAQICPQKFLIDSAMQCQSCEGDLQMDFRPYRHAYYFENSRIREINCTVNKPSNISILFHDLWKPITEEPRELTTTTSTFGMTLHRLNGGCTYTIKFPEPSSGMTICNIGRFTCRAVTDTNENITKTQKVDGYYASGIPSFTFTIEDPELKKTNELILGTSANLSCSFATRTWGFFGPFILYWQISDNGGVTQVLDSNETPQRYETQSRIQRINHLNYDVATRRLFLRRIGQDANRTFLCRVVPFRFGECEIEQRLELRIRPCKAGYYCDPNSSKELPCEEGTYSNVTGLFDKSGCKTCPLNAYCPSGSTLPIPCPASQFFPARKTRIRVYEGKRHEDECRWCPVDPCDKVGEQCTFICGNTRFKGISDKRVSIHCLLSNGTLMRNLSWYKGNKKIVDGASHEIDNEENKFVLTIHKLSLNDAGDYVCSGFDMIMGHQFNNTVHLYVKASSKNPKMLISVPLLISFAVLLIAVYGVLVWVYRRKNKSWSSTKDEGIRFVNDVETLLVS